MTMELRYSPQFEADVAEARAWYEERQAGLGARFERELQSILGLIVEHPMLYPEVSREARRARMHSFPYLVIYRVHADFILIATVVHGARHPSIQRRRLK